MADLDKTKEELLMELEALRQRVRELEELQTPSWGDERYSQAANTLLRLFAAAATRQEYLGHAVKLISIWSDCRYVGIRVLNNDGMIPYEAYLGFSREFWESENWLSIHRDQCACIRVITGKPDDQDVAMMTRGGSFYLNNSFQFVQGLSADGRARYRGCCMRCGFKSIAVIPIPFRGKILGVIHIADEEEGRVNLPLVEFLESVAFSIGQALHRFSGEEDERVSDTHMRMLMEGSQDWVSLISRDGVCLAINTAGCQRLGCADPEPILGQSVAANLGDYREEMMAAVRRAAAGEEVPVRYQTVGPTGRRMWWNAMLIPVKRTDGSTRVIVNIAKDITPRLEGE